MSNLGKFQGTEAWFAQLKRNLTRERISEPNPKSKPNEVLSENRYSLDLSEDFIVILEEKSIPSQAREMADKENLSLNNMPANNKRGKDSLFDNSSFLFKSHNDSTLLEDPSLLRQITDDSFECVERMCDKTVSDPDSTLFTYMQSFDQTKDESRTRSVNSLLRDIDSAIADDSANKTLFDQTQLNDVEAPSMLWENTISGGDGFQTSPVKMVGMTRPSTILEEDSSYCESDNSAASFLTAEKTVETTSSCFETANETLASHRAQHGMVAKYKKVQMNDSQSSASTNSILVDSLNISKRNNNSKDTLEDVSSMMEDSLQVSECRKSEKHSKTVSIDDESIIELSDDDYEPNENDASLNKGFSLQLENDEDLNEESVHFDDTLEDVENIMKKYQQYLETGSVPKLTESPCPSPSLRVFSPSPRAKTPVTPSTIISKPKAMYALSSSGKKPTLATTARPKYEIFKKPNSKIPQPKCVTMAKKQQSNFFSHVVSPVGAYIKNTPKTPSFVTAKLNGDVFQSKAMRELEFQSKTTTNSVGSPIATNVVGASGSSSLPKKAYISAEYKHITDERTPITIPGGEKIHKYLQSSMIPAVIRHEGKLKMNNFGPNQHDLRETASVDDTLADLSLMSGDVSVYTIKDAKKF